MKRPRRPRKCARWHARRIERALNGAIHGLGYRDTVVRRRAAEFTGRSSAEVNALIARLVGGLTLGPEKCRNWEMLAEKVNKFLATSGGGLPLVDGWIECPKCHREVPTLADPQEWSRWPGDNRWKVESYWAGTAQCCDFLLAFQPDGRPEAYEL